MLEIKDRKLFVSGKEYKMFSAEVEYFRIRANYWEKVLRLLLDTEIQIVNTYVPWRVHSLVRGGYDLPPKKWTQ